MKDFFCCCLIDINDRQHVYYPSVSLTPNARRSKKNYTRVFSFSSVYIHFFFLRQCLWWYSNIVFCVLVDKYERSQFWSGTIFSTEEIHGIVRERTQARSLHRERCTLCSHFRGVYCTQKGCTFFPLLNLNRFKSHHNVNEYISMIYSKKKYIILKWYIGSAPLFSWNTLFTFPLDVAKWWKSLQTSIFCRLLKRNSYITW